MSLIGTPGINRVALYIRVSTEEQADEGWSVDAQERLLREFCKDKKWQIVEVYKDEGRTGTNTNRPGFQAMLRDARERKFDAIVVHKLDRFSRNLVDVLMTLDDLQKKGVSFVSATEAMLDFTTQIGRFILLVLAFFAQWYVENLSAETTKGKKERFEQGLYNGDLRFGYSKGEDGKPVPNNDAEGVRLAYQWCADGKTDAEIATLLNAAGYRTYRYIENNKKKAAPEVDPNLRRPWTKDSVAVLLRAGQFYLGNTIYVGKAEEKRYLEAYRRGEIYNMQVQTRTGTHPAIVTLEVYGAALLARAKRTNPGRLQSYKAPRAYLLGQGLARCSICGEPLRCTCGGKAKNFLYYQCAVQFRGMECSASRAKFREESMLAQVERMIEQLTLPDDWREHVRTLLATEQGADRGVIEARMSELKEELNRLSFQHQKKLIDDDQMVRQAAPVKDELEQLTRQAIHVPIQIEEAGELLITYQTSWQMANKAQKRDMLYLMFDAVYVDVNSGTIESFQPHEDFIPLFRQTGLVERDGRYYLK